MPAFNKAFNQVFNYAYNGWSNGAVGLIPVNNNLSLLTDPGETLGMGTANQNKTEILGPDLVTNGDFHDFTMEDDSDSIAHYIFDKTYTEEDGLEYIGSERSGSESLIIDSSGIGDFENDTNSDGFADGWTATANGSNTNQSLVDWGSSQAQRIERIAAGWWQLNTESDVITNGNTYKLSFQYKSNLNIACYIGNGGSQIGLIPNSSGALSTFELVFVADSTDYLLFATSSDGYFEVDKVELLQIPTGSLIPSGFSDGFDDEYITSDTQLLTNANDVSYWGNFSSNNTIEYDSALDAIKCTYADSANGMLAILNTTNGLSRLFQNGERCRVTLKAKVNTGSVTVGFGSGDVADNINPTTVSVTSTDFATYTFDGTVLNKNTIDIRCTSMGSGEIVWIKDVNVYSIPHNNPAYQNGGVLRFNGVDQYLTGGDINDVTTELTVEAWIKTTASNAGNMVIAGKRPSAQARYFMALTSDGYLTGYVSDATPTTAQITDSTDLRDGEWHHVAFVMDQAAGGYLYVDGVEVVSEETAEWTGLSTITSSGDFEVGHFGSGSLYFDGYIAEVRISDSARGANDIFRSAKIARNWYPYINPSDSPHDNVNFAQKVGRATSSGVIKLGNTTSDAVFSLTADSLYKIEFDILSYTAGSYIQVYFQGNAGYDTLVGASEIEVGRFHAYRTGAYIGTYFSIYGQTVGDEIVIDNVSLKEVTNAETPDDGFVEDFSQGGSSDSGLEYVDNPNMDDYTQGDVGTRIAHYIFDKAYELEDDIQCLCSERTGSETDLHDIDCQTDTNGDGRADGISSAANGTVSMVSGNGFSGNAQRFDLTNGYTVAFLNLPAVTLDTSKKYMFECEYRCSGGDLYLANGITAQLDENTGNAKTAYTVVTGGYSGSISVRLTVYGGGSGDWLEVANIKLTELPANSLSPQGFSDGFLSEYTASGSNVYYGGGTLSLNGTSQYFNGGNINDITTGNLTISIVFKTTMTSAAELVCKSSGTTALGYRLSLNSSYQATFRIEDVSSNSASITGGTALNDGAWHQVTVAYDATGNTIDLYVDGASDASQVDASAVTGSLTNTQHFRIGENSNGTRLFEGDIGEVALFSDVPTANEVRLMYGAPKDWRAGSGNLDDWNTPRVMGEFKYSHDGSGYRQYQAFTSEAGKLYKLTIQGYDEGASGGRVQVTDSGDNVMNPIFFTTQSALYTRYFQGDGNAYQVRLVTNSTSRWIKIERCSIDLLDNGNHGYMMPETTMEDSQPTHPYALDFNGVDEYILFDNQANFEPETNSLFVSLWIKMGTASATQGILTKRSDVNSGAGWDINYSSVNRFRVGWQDTNGSANAVTFDTGSTLSANQWYHATFHLKAGEVPICYINNSLANVASSTGAIHANGVNTSAHSLIMGNYTALTKYIDAQIGITAVYISSGSINHYTLTNQIYQATKGYYEDE